MRKSSSPLCQFLSQSVINVVGQAVASFLAFLFNYVVVRSITPAVYGEYTAALAYVTLLSAPLSVVSLAVTQHLSRTSPAHRASAMTRMDQQIWDWLVRHWGWIGLGLILIAGWLGWGANFLTPASVGLVLVVLIATAATTYLTAQLTGSQWFGGLSAAAIVAMGVRCLLGWLGLKEASSVASLYVILIVANWLAVAVYGGARRHYRRHHAAKTAPAAAARPPTALTGRADWGLTLATAFLTAALINLDVVTVKMVAPAATAGAYAALSLFAKIILYASQPLINVAFTFFNSLPRASATTVLAWSTAGILGLTAVMVGLYAGWPELVIQLVVGSEYLGLRDSLWLAALFGGGYSLVMLVAQALLARKQRALRWSWLVPVVQLGLIIIYHPRPAGVLLVNIAVCAGTWLWLLGEWRKTDSC